jgi:hypothetical protein
MACQRFKRTALSNGFARFLVAKKHSKLFFSAHCGNFAMLSDVGIGKKLISRHCDLLAHKR